MQNDFCLPDAILCVKQGIQCLSKVQEAVSICRQKHYHVIWVIRSHDRQGAFLRTNLHRLHRLPFPPLHTTQTSPLPTPLLNTFLLSGLDVEKFRQNLYTNGPGATVSNTSGAALVSPLTPLPLSEPTIIKTRFSAFFATNLDLLLRRLGITEVILAGVQTPNCIRATAFDALALDYDVTVLSDGTGAASDQVQQSNLMDMMNVGIRVIETSSID